MKMTWMHCLDQKITNRDANGSLMPVHGFSLKDIQLTSPARIA
jgi:hypothetical protein